MSHEETKFSYLGLDIDDDVLQAVKELAAARAITAGQASELARKGLMVATQTSRVRNGVPLLPHRAPGALRPTIKQVNGLRD